MTTEKHWTPPTLEQHLFGPGPKRILSLDGGGTLGVIEIAFLEKIEEVLRKQHGDHPDFRLCDYFDLIGGTSTGALIATGLALRMKACEIKKLYFDMGQKVFKNRLLHIPGYHGYGKYPFRAGALVDVIKPIVGDEQLQSDALKTGLAIVTKRLDTASPWVLTNNRRSLYWRYDPELHDYPFVDNCTFKLLELLRASTAAPLAFNPKTILIGRRATDAAGKPIGDEDEIGVFVDGGLTPYNNPSMKLFMVAGIKKYGFGWRLGAQELQLISIGSGWHRPRIKRDRAERMLAYEAAVASARGAIWDAQVHALTQMQWMSDLVASWKINSEIGDLADDVLAPSDVRSRGLLSFQRFDVQLDKKWLGAALSGSEISREMTQAEVDSLTSDTAFTNPRIMELAYSIASAVAGKQVTSEHFPRDFHLYRVRDVAPEQIIVLLQKAAQEEKSMMEERKNAKLRPPRTVGVVGHRWNRLPSSEPEIARINQQLARIMHQT